ncbi:RagB/SusD family nutrient uptake outer membrane protein [Labilibacter sediminis]|nr:RagB/SusD family nutrient uptake outer membrane protein [Labilibacter sediminis]
MKKIIQNIIYIAIVTILFSSCKESLLDLYPYGVLTDANYQDTTQIDQSIYTEANVLKIYAHMRGWGAIQWPYLGVMSIISDDADKGSTPTDGAPQIALENFTFNSSDYSVTTVYQDYFMAVALANESLAELDSLDIEVAPKRDQLIAEVRFLRAYHYFRLTQMFGGLPVLTEPLPPDAPVPARKTLQETQDFIEADLLAAINGLPDKSYYMANGGLGRATKGAAQGFLAKLYLYQQRWGDVLTQTNAILNSGIYDLSTPIDKIFTEAEENGRESLFEMQAQETETLNATSGYATVQGVRGSLNRGWGFNVPSQKLIDAFEQGDPRFLTTVLVSGTTLSDGTYIPSVSEGVVNPYYNMKVHQWANELAKDNRLPFGGWINARILRTADIFLMYAEAANELGQTNEALAKLEMVRNRARNGITDVLPEVTTTDQLELRAAIQHERRIELAMEFERYFDLIRWGLAEEALGPNGWTKGKHEVYPIPQIEIDRSQGTLIQNPGY